MRKSKKLVSLLLAVVMTLSCFACLSSVSAFAAEGDTLKGDVDKNGEVNITDVSIIQMYVASFANVVEKFNDGTYDLDAADVDDSGAIDIVDATLVQLIIAHAQPTTAEPTTVEPTTVEPTTEAPTTEAPTTEEPTTEPAGEDIFVLAGSANFLENGWSADPGVNVMTKGEDGVYSANVNVFAEEGALYQVKVVQFVGGDPANAVWHGMDGTDLNYDFMLNDDGTVTVTYNPETAEIAVTGPSVIPPVYDIKSIAAVGNGQGNFLNGIVWDPAAEENKMEEVSEGVYEITFEECETNTDYQFKFAANGGWDINWGLATDVVYNTPMEAAYNGDNALLNYESEDEYFDVTLRLDITGWDTIKKTGAKITVVIEGAPEPTTEEPTTVEPTVAPTTAEPTTEEPTEAPTTEAPTTEAPTTEPAAEDVFVLAGSSNFVETGWSPDPDSYVMEKGEDGVYSVVVPEVAAEEGALYQVKVVQFVGGDAANAVWHGMDGTDLNYDFMLNADCDVTVTYNPETGEINVTGDGVIPPVYNIESIAAVGNGQNNFLNGIVWDPAAEENKMEEVSEGVYEITFEECETNTDYQFKFAANGGWDINWGLDTDVVYNTPMEAAYNGGNALLNYESEEETFDVTLRLDLTGWDTIKKTGAKITVVIEGAPEPTTEEPTTEAPTTEAPTTEAPTTEEPTTEAPTTEAPTTEPAAEDIFVLAGSSNFVETGWSPDPDSYVMEKGEDGIYSVVVPEVAAEEGALYQVKVVQFVGGDAANAVWHGMDGTDLNYDFMLNADCDVTVTYNPETGEINVTGDGVIPPVYNIESIAAVGNGQNNFLNGIVWDPASEENKMEEVSEGVYEITFEECDTNTDYQFKFAANGGWDINWGLDTDVVYNTPMEAAYNGGNALLNYESEEETFDVTLRLDLTGWDTIKKTGAKITVVIEGAPEPTTEEPTTEAPTTEAPTTEAPTTEAPTTEEPTTEEPTTEAPTTEAPTTEPAAEDIYVLAGSSNFVDTGWSPDPDSYVMEKGEDGIYSVVVPEVAAEEGALYQVKVVQFVGGDAANAVWHGMDGTDLNYDFMLTADGDVTVTYNPETGEINVTGDGVIPPVYNIESIAAVGNGQNNFLNGIVWDPAAAENTMEEVSEGVYEITFEECDTNTDYQFKFAANGGWDINWGLDTDVVYNTPMEAAYNGGNALLNYESENDYVDVTLRLDLTNWDTIKKTGAKITVFVEEVED